MIGTGDKFFQVGQTIGFGVSVDQFCLDVWLTGLLARHLHWKEKIRVRAGKGGKGNTDKTGETISRTYMRTEGHP